MARTRKYTSKLRKLLDEDTQTEYEPTLNDCKKWFRILNRELFDSSLTPPDEIDIRWRRKCYAAYEAKKKPRQYTKIMINKRYKSKQFFVEVLAHELVHHYQFLNNLPLGHGIYFECWAEAYKKKGLNLVKDY